MRTAEERFWEKVNKTDGCWEWAAARIKTGYGKFGLAGRWVLAHRFSWGLHNGPVPEGLCVLHRCDNPPCVNPAHLFLGTPKENSNDREAKGRGNTSKLTETAVLQIRQEKQKGMPTRKLAQRFLVSERNIRKITKGESWRHVA